MNTNQNQPSKFTTLRVQKSKRNKLRRIAERTGTTIEEVTKHIIDLGLSAYQKSVLKNP